MKTSVTAMICVILLMSMNMASAVTIIEIDANGGGEGSTIDIVTVDNYADFYARINNFDTANIDVSNHWGCIDDVQYDNVNAGEIFVRCGDRSAYQTDEWAYYDWYEMPIDGNGVYAPGGGRSVTVTNSSGITGWIEYYTTRPSYWACDTRPQPAKLTIWVHNGHPIEGANVAVKNGHYSEHVTDADGMVYCEPSSGWYSVLVEHENYDSVYVQDLMLESGNDYMLHVSLVNGTASAGDVITGDDIDEETILYMHSRDAEMTAIDVQEYVNYFADRLRTCMSGSDHNADGTLERYATNYGVYPDPPLNVMLYDCNITKMTCVNDQCDYRIEFTVKNYQKYPCEYTVNLMVKTNDGNTETIHVGDGVLGSTHSASGMETAIRTMSLGNDVDNLYLAVVSDRLTV